jgi:hypothetical protein
MTMTGTTLDPGSRPVIHATYELEHRTWLIRALLDDGREILAHTDRLTDIATTTRDQLVADAQLQPDSFDVTLTHRVRASIHPPAGNVQLTFTVAEVANLLHVDGASVYRWVKAGILIPVKNDGRHLSFGARAVRQLLAGEYRAS